MAIIQGVTPTFTLTVPEDIDLTEAANVYATFQQSKTILTKKGADLDISAHEVGVYLKQAETLAFEKGRVLVQLNWTYADGSRCATQKKGIEWDDNLLREVLQ